MAKSLVIVESPAKVKTINKILGKAYKVVSSMGHLIDLPKSTLGIDLENNFKPKLIVIRSKQKLLTKLKKEAKTKTNIYIATDPDREGEAIGWNLANEIGKDKNVYRVSFHEITKEAVLKAFENLREFDSKKIDAQIARRVLDRLVGYQLSPLLWKKVGAGLSAGRVQSVALRLIVERDKAIAAFIPQEYWQVSVDLKKENSEDILNASLDKIAEDKPDLKSQSQTDGIVEEIGLRSTKIRTLTGTRVTIPNSVFSENAIENVTVEPSRKIKLNLGLTYDTKPEKIEKAMGVLKNIAEKEKDVDKNYKIAFNSFGDFSLGVMFIYYIKKGGDILKIQNDVNLKILKEFNKNGINMAFPTQTIELKK